MQGVHVSTSSAGEKADRQPFIRCYLPNSGMIVSLPDGTTTDDTPDGYSGWMCGNFDKSSGLDAWKQSIPPGIR